MKRWMALFHHCDVRRRLSRRRDGGRSGGCSPNIADSSNKTVSGNDGALRRAAARHRGAGRNHADGRHGVTRLRAPSAARALPIPRAATPRVPRAEGVLSERPVANQRTGYRGAGGAGGAGEPAVWWSLAGRVRWRICHQTQQHVRLCQWGSVGTTSVGMVGELRVLQWWKHQRYVSINGLSHGGSGSGSVGRARAGQVVTPCCHRWWKRCGRWFQPALHSTGAAAPAVRVRVAQAQAERAARVRRQRR